MVSRDNDKKTKKLYFSIGNSSRNAKKYNFRPDTRDTHCQKRDTAGYYTITSTRVGCR